MFDLYMDVKLRLCVIILTGTYYAVRVYFTALGNFIKKYTLITEFGQLITKTKLRSW